MTGQDAAALAPELVLLAAAVLGLLAGSWLPRGRQWLVRAAAAAACVAAVVTAARAAGPARQVFDATYTIDAATTTARVVVPLAALLALWLADATVRGHRRETEFTVLVLLATLGSVLLAGASDLLMLVSAFLLAGVPLYALAGWVGGVDAVAARASEAAMKYYLSGAFAGVTMLAGVTVLYGAGGATGFGPLRAGLGQGPVPVVAVGLVAVLVGLLFEAGAVPAHFWVPDVADGTPVPVAAVVTTLPKVGALIAVYRLLAAAVPVAEVDWPLLVAVVAAASMTLGNLAAFFQDSPQRLLGYSTISQVGYLLMAVAVAGRAVLALPSLLFYLGAYAVTNLGAFAVLAALPVRTLDGHRGLARRHPVLAAALVVCLLGLVGTPPTAVFLGKLTVFTAAVDGGTAWLVVVAVGNTVASVFYYVRWFGPVFGPAGDGPDTCGELDAPARGPATAAVTAAAASVLLGIAGGPLLAALGSG